MAIYKPKIYTASKIHYQKLWRTLREDPDWDFVEFTASWVTSQAVWDEHNGDQPGPELFCEGWIQDIFDVQRSDFVLVYGKDSETLRGSLIEAGAGLGLGLTVIVVGLSHHPHTWMHHPSVKVFGSLREARLFLMRYTTMVPPTRRRKGKLHADER